MNEELRQKSRDNDLIEAYNTLIEIVENSSFLAGYEKGTIKKVIPLCDKKEIREKDICQH